MTDLGSGTPVKVRETDPTPPALVSGGRFQLGRFAAPLERINPLDAKLRDGRDIPRRVKSLLLKEWQHFALVNDRFYVSLAIFDTKRIGIAQVIVYDRERDQLLEYERKLLSRDIDLPDQLFDDRARVDKGGVSISVHNHLENGVHIIELECQGGDGRPHLRGRFECFEDPSRHAPLVVCLPLSRHRAMYSHKGIFPLRGELELGPDHFEFVPERSYALVDVHKGYYPYVMMWRWATGAHMDDARGLVGFNLTNNQVADQDRYNENALWVDGRLHWLPAVDFEFDPEHVDRPWTIRDQEGRVDLQFRPDTVRRVDLNLLLLESRYRGPFGEFAGTLIGDDGEAVRVDGAYGMCEDFYLRG